MLNAIGLRLAVVAAAVLAAAPLAAPAQSIEQLTDYRIGIAGPPAITGDGSTIWTGGALNYGSNPLAKYQLFKLDRTTGAGTQVSTFEHGVLPASLDLSLKGLVAVSDDGAWVAFVGVSDPLGTNHDRSAELFVMDSNGGQLAQLTSDPSPTAGSVTSIAMAGSGNRIVFTSTSDLVPGMNPLNRENVFIVDRTGGPVTQLTPTDFPAATFAGGVTISDDGTKIGFAFNGNLGDLDMDGTEDNDDFSFEVFTILNDGTGLRQVTDGEGWDSTSVVITGDGTKIVYQSNDDPAGATGGNNKNQDEIFIIDWDGSSNWRQLTDSKSNVLNAEPSARNPSVSDTDPDGTGHIITFGSTHATTAENSDGNGEIYRIRSDGTEFRVATDATFSDGSAFPVISGDGTTIAFYSLDDLDGTLNGRDNDDISPELFVVDDSDDNADGTYNVNAVQLTAGLLGVYTKPQLTPNGLILTFVSDADPDGSDADRGGEIFKANPDGTGRVQVTNLFTGGIGDHDISPDGLRIVFSSDSDPDGSNVDQGFELFFINADGTGLERVTDELLRDKRVFNTKFNHAGTYAYMDWNGDEGSNPQNNREIWRVNTTAPYTMEQLTTTLANVVNRNARLSTDDQWLVYQSDADDDMDGTHNWQVVRAAADGLDPFVVCGDSSYECVEPDVSNDGSVVVFSSNGDLVPGMNPEGNYELFKYEFGTGTTTQLTTTTSGASNRARLSASGEWLYFQTNSTLFEADPDNPFHFARMHLATGTIERIGALTGGFMETMAIEDSGAFVVYSANGNPILQNWDGSEELFIVRHDVPRAALCRITVSPGPAPTTLTIPEWVSGPMRYDFLRGNVADLQVLGGVVDLGAAVCVENDSLDLDTVGDEDAVNPAAGEAFFYLWRGDEGANRTNSWGTSFDWDGSPALERVPQAGSGCLPN